MNAGCACTPDTSFSEWLQHFCPAGPLDITPSSPLGIDNVFQALLRDLCMRTMHQLFSGAVQRGSVLRGLIPEDQPHLFFVTFGLAGPETETVEGNSWHSASQHRVAFLVPLEEAQAISMSNMWTVWAKGELAFVNSAPLSDGGHWRLTLSRKPRAGPAPGGRPKEFLIILLDWVGNKYFAYLALSRSLITQQYQSPCLKAWVLSTGRDAMQPPPE